MAIEVSKLTLDQQNELADALLVYHLADDSPQPTVALLELPTQLATPELPRCVFIPPKEGKLFSAWPSKLPDSKDIEEISRLTIYVLSLWRDARDKANHSRDPKLTYSSREIDRITSHEPRLGCLGAHDLDLISDKLGLKPAQTHNTIPQWSVGQILTLLTASHYDKPGSGGLSKADKKTLARMCDMYPQAAAFLDERNGTVGSVSQSRYGNAGHRRLRK